MAATGVVVVSTEGDFYSRSTIEKGYYDDGHSDLESSLCNNSHSPRNGLSKKSNRSHVGFHHNHGNGYTGKFIHSRSRRGEAHRDELVQFPPEKRRKYHPDICILKDKEVRISSKNQLGTALPSSKTKALAHAADKVNSEKPFCQNKVNESFMPMSLEPASPVLSYGEKFGGDHESSEMEEELLDPNWNIGKSRWASHCDSPSGSSPSEELVITRIEKDGSQSSTPENGEFLRDETEEKRTSSCVSDVTGDTPNEYLQNDINSENVMDTDETRKENSAESLISLDLDKSPVSSPDRIGFNSMCGSRSVFDYERLNKINEGTYGVVYRAREKKTGEVVALKKIKLFAGREDGFPITSLREINILVSFSHPSIVNVKEVAVDNDNVFMVMEHIEHDLKGVMEVMKHPFSTSEVKNLMLQLLEGVQYLHNNWVIHRDLKPANLLYNNNGELKIADFGMSRLYGSPLKPYTQLVVTQWYRAPELLLGAKQYSTAIDIWSVGCIMAELLSRKPIFQGRSGSDIDQLNKIFGVLGKPNDVQWPGFSELTRGKAKFTHQPYNLLRKNFPITSFTGSPVLSDLGLDLLNKLLTYDPEMRITAEDALNHEWFREVPLPKTKDFMPTYRPRYC